MQESTTTSFKVVRVGERKKSNTNIDLSPSKDRTAEFFALCQRGSARLRYQPDETQEQKIRKAAYGRVQQVRSGECELPADQVFNLAIHATRRAQEAAFAERNDDRRLHYCIVEQLLITEQTQLQPPLASQNAGALRGIEKQLHMVNVLYDTVCELVRRQGHTIDAVERRVDQIALRIDASESELSDAAPRKYRTRRAEWADRLPFMRSKLLWCIILFFSLNIVLFWNGHL